MALLAVMAIAHPGNPLRTRRDFVVETKSTAYLDVQISVCYCSLSWRILCWDSLCDGQGLEYLVGKKRDNIKQQRMWSLLSRKTIEVEADKAIYIGIADVAQVLERRILIVRNSTVRSRDEPCEQKGEDLLLRRQVTLLLAPSYKATNEMRGRSQVNCISSWQHLTFAPRPMAETVVCPQTNQSNSG